jgi:hypothetical protein
LKTGFFTDDGFYEWEILQLFDQVAKKRERFPLWLTPLPDSPPGEIV